MRPRHFACLLLLTIFTGAAWGQESPQVFEARQPIRAVIKDFETDLALIKGKVRELGRTNRQIEAIAGQLRPIPKHLRGEQAETIDRQQLEKEQKALNAQKVKITRMQSLIKTASRQVGSLQNDVRRLKKDVRYLERSSGETRRISGNFGISSERVLGAGLVAGVRGLDRQSMELANLVQQETAELGKIGQTLEEAKPIMHFSKDEVCGSHLAGNCRAFDCDKCVECCNKEAGDDAKESACILRCYLREIQCSTDEAADDVGDTSADLSSLATALMKVYQDTHSATARMLQ